MSFFSAKAQKMKTLSCPKKCTILQEMNYKKYKSRKLELKLLRQTATRLSRTCFNLTMKYELYPLDNEKPLENLK